MSYFFITSNVMVMTDIHSNLHGIAVGAFVNIFIVDIRLVFPVSSAVLVCRGGYFSLSVILLHVWHTQILAFSHKG